MTRIRKPIKIVLVEDDPYYNKLLTKYVRTVCSSNFYPEFDFEIKTYLSAHDCIEELDNDMNILILDYFLFNSEEDEILNGYDVLNEAKKYCPDCKIILLSALRSKSKILELMEEGLYAYIDKNVNSRDRVGAILQRAMREERTNYC